MKTYVVIAFDEDGDPPSVEEIGADELRKRLKEDYWGERPVFAEPGKEFDSGSFSGLVVIEGKIVKPKAIQVATDYDL